MKVVNSSTRFERISLAGTTYHALERTHSSWATEARACRGDLSRSVISTCAAEAVPGSFAEHPRCQVSLTDQRPAPRLNECLVSAVSPFTPIDEIESEQIGSALGMLPIFF